MRQGSRLGIAHCKILEILDWIARCRRKTGLSYWIHLAAQSTLGLQQWDLLVSEHSVCFQVKIADQSSMLVR